MPVNNPVIKPDPAESSWDLEVTQVLNNLEQRHISLLQTVAGLDIQSSQTITDQINLLTRRFNTLLLEIQNASDLDELKTRTRNL